MPGLWHITSTVNTVSSNNFGNKEHCVVVESNLLNTYSNYMFIFDDFDKWKPKQTAMK